MEKKINILYSDKINNLEKINKRFGRIIDLLKTYMDGVSKDMQVDISLNIKY